MYNIDLMLSCSLIDTLLEGYVLNLFPFLYIHMLQWWCSREFNVPGFEEESFKFGREFHGVGGEPEGYF